MSIRRYDPEVAPDPQAWKELGEGAAMDLIAAYHQRHDHDHQRAQSPRMHCIIHTIVENQAAMGDELHTAATLRRLVAEGLSRHDAVHAVASVVAEDIHDILEQQNLYDEDQRRKGEARLDALSAAGWRESFDSNEVAGAEDGDDCGDPSCEHGHGVPVRNEMKIGRNEPCPCGSGAKYKKCCGK